MKLRIAILAILLFVVTNIADLVAQTFASPVPLSNTTEILNPTAITFGPDQRLYYLDVTGDIYIYTIVRDDTGIQIKYNVVNTDTIGLIRRIQNHNDDGSQHAVVKRQATGIFVSGTVENPVIYVTSSDYRIKEFGSMQTGLDTNSGIISKLTWNGSEWVKVDLVRGLPRSEENHSTNALILDTVQNILYVAQGGNTNAGGPGTLLGSVSEYALAAAILTVDLNVIDTMDVLIDSVTGAAYVYDLPTVDDPRRSNHNGIDDPLAPGYDGKDINDPFGGNDGLNQAKWLADGPVQVYSPGYRNPYDILMSEKGYLFSWDNGPNPFWGGAPINEGLGTATNEQTGSGGTVYNIDGLHRIDSMGYYAGHANPIRSNPDSAGLLVGTAFLTEYDPGNPNLSLPYDWPPLDSALRDPQEGIYIPAGQPGDQSICTVPMSTNGMAEYTATNFDSVMTGDILAVGWSGKIFRAHLDSTGRLCDSVTTLFNVSNLMLDVLCQGDNDPFPGTIWLLRHVSSGNGISIYEPQDFVGCTGGDFPNIDEDLDGYTNSDELDNGTNPCNAGDSPASKDFDGTLIGGFLVSDMNDPDDDDDGILDIHDHFARDSSNGMATELPLELPLLNNDPGTGFFGLGFTGLMNNGSTDYLEQLKNEDNSGTQVIAGGASGVLTFIGVDTGDASGSINTQANAFQVGIPIDSATPPVLIRTTLIGPLFPDTIQDSQSIGVYIGTGDQDNYVKLAVGSVGEQPKLQVVLEENGITNTTNYTIDAIDTVIAVNLMFVVNPANGMVFPFYAINDTVGIPIGSGVETSGALLNAIRSQDALAVGLISTARGSTNEFEATWDYIAVRFDPEANGVQMPGDWAVINNGSGCMPGECPTGRHECTYVQSGDKFYLIGGREASSLVEAYDPVSENWTTGAIPPGGDLHHFQGVDYHGLILVAGAFRGSFPNEESIDTIYVYDPISDLWYQGPPMPDARERGAAATAIVEDTLYLIGGNTMGHLDGAVGWSDKYEFGSNTWNTLPDAPHRRDHFQSGTIGNKIYAAAGRRTGSMSSYYSDMEEIVDVFDVSTQTWDTLMSPIPTTRAGAATAVLQNEIIIIGGERDAGVAERKAEALNVQNDSWRTLDSLNDRRHGTHAISNNGSVYIAGGSLIQGAILEISTERYEPYGPTDPILVPTIQSSLAVSDTAIVSPSLMLDSSTYTLLIANTGGTQALIITGVSLADSTVFVLDSAITFPRFLKPGAVLELPVRFKPQTMGFFTDSLIVSHSGANAPSSTTLLMGEGRFNWLGQDRIYVDSASIADPQFGTSWDSAVTSLALAFEAATDFPQIREIWISKGTYAPRDIRTASFNVTDSLNVTGGFSGSETLLSEAQPEVNLTVLSGDIGAAGDSTDNVYHVISIPASVDTAVLSGLHIRYGQADGPEPSDRVGAGVWNLGNATIKHSVISNCVSIDAGSAIHSSGGNAVLRLAMISLIDNSDPFLVNKSGSTIRWIGDGLLR